MGLVTGRSRKHTRRDLSHSSGRRLLFTTTGGFVFGVVREPILVGWVASCKRGRPTVLRLGGPSSLTARATHPTLQMKRVSNRRRNAAAQEAAVGVSGVANFQLRCLDALAAALMAGQQGIESARREQRALDGIRRSAGVEQFLDIRDQGVEKLRAGR